jgi:small subunit ribosomal protein S17
MVEKEKKQKIEKKTEEHKIECNDNHCPIHSNLSTRGREFIGTVKKLNVQKTAVVSWERLFYLQKYERYEKRKSRLSVHVPSCMIIAVGDNVKIAECRPISKTKNFVIIEKLREK